VRLSIITAVLNAAPSIGACLQSVAQEDLIPEHLVIDGGSTDATLPLLEAWKGHLLRIVSGQDRGIYDALNKGIACSTGDVIGILHADDYYADRGVLERVGALFSDPVVDACYGDLAYVDCTARGGPECRRADSLDTASLVEKDGELFLPGEKVVRVWRAGKGNARSFYHGWMPPHPTFFVRRRIYEQIGQFRLDLGSAADYEFMLRAMVKHGIRAVYLPSILVKMRVGGVSNASLKNRWRANRMDRQAWRVNALRPYPWTVWLKPLRKVGQWWPRATAIRS
jgi:glycosyltransferase involved in cell wall biosynthesis